MTKRIVQRIARLETRAAELESAIPDKHQSMFDLTLLSCDELDWIKTRWDRLQARDITEAENETVEYLLGIAAGRRTRPGLNCPGHRYECGEHSWKVRCGRCNNQPEHCAAGTPISSGFDLYTAVTN